VSFELLDFIADNPQCMETHQLHLSDRYPQALTVCKASEVDAVDYRDKTIYNLSAVSAVKAKPFSCPQQNMPDDFRR
jgi:hypothetical protein